MDFLRTMFGRISGWFSGIWEKTEKRDRTRFLVISGVAVVLIIAAMMMLNGNRYTDLTSIDDPAKRSSASAALSENGVRHKVSGSTVQVDKNDYNDAWAVLLSMSDVGIGDYSFDDLYGQATGLTATDADRRKYATFQVESNLKRTFEALPMVSSANVLIYVPEKQGFFAADQKPSTASVVLFLTAEISQRQVEMFEQFVANAAGIAPENVVITDENMKPLKKTANEEDEVSRLGDNYAHQKRVEQDKANAAMQMMTAIFGPDNVLVNVSARLNFDEHIVESVEFSPVVGDDEGIVRSMETLAEHARGIGPLGGQPGTDENGLGMEAAEYVEVMENLMSEWDKNQDRVNYEINEVNEYLRTEKGTVESITASVAINADLLEREGLEESTEAIRSLVGAIIGVRPDQYNANVVVSYIPMMRPRIAAADQDAFDAQIQRERFYFFLQTLILYVIVGICVIILILRTFALLKPKPVELPEELLGAGDADEYADLLEAATVNMELEVTKTPSRERIEEFIETNAEAVASMLRTWLQEEEDHNW